MKTTIITRCGPRRFKVEYPDAEHATRFHRSRTSAIYSVKDHDVLLALALGKPVVRAVTWIGCKPPKEA